MEKLDACQALLRLYCEADDLLRLPPVIPARSVSVEVTNLADKIESLQKEVGRISTEMNNNIKSLSAKAVLTTVTASDGPSSLLTRTVYSKAAGEDLAGAPILLSLGFLNRNRSCMTQPRLMKYWAMLLEEMYQLLMHFTWVNPDVFSTSDLQFGYKRASPQISALDYWSLFHLGTFITGQRFDMLC